MLFLRREIHLVKSLKSDATFWRKIQFSLFIIERVVHYQV
jgi:hypothetical protein